MVMRKHGGRPVNFGSLPGVAYWERRLEEECARAGRYQRPFVVVVLALSSGDAPPGRLVPPPAGVVTLAAESLRAGLRDSDVLCGLTPQSFGLLLVETDLEGAEVVVRRLYRCVQRGVTRCLPADMLPQIHIGMAAYTPDRALPAELFAAATADLERRLHAAPVHVAR